ncbi:ring-cleaving dioxygenase, partial [bacterium]
MERILGLHHITTIASDAAANYDFYVRFLGLRLVKKTVNFDDPGTYHLYYGDEEGHPGTIMTFFPWPGARRGRPGAGEATGVAFAIPVGSLSFWKSRAETQGHHVESLEGRLGDIGLSLRDPDGLRIELVESGVPGSPREDIPAEAAIGGFFAATLEIVDLLPTIGLLTGTMGLEPVADDGRRFRFRTVTAPGQFIDLLHVPSGPWGQLGAGTVHHIAFRAKDDADQLGWRETLDAAGHEVTEVRDRNYFHSIYFREPGGVLFEIATDPPGFAVDEPKGTMGERLMLPEWLESQRVQ